MSGGVRLTIATPAAVLVDVDGVRSVRAEDESGAFGVLPGHADLVTALPPSVLRWTRDGEPMRYCALGGGVLTISGGNRVAVACRRGVLGDDLDRLEAAVASEHAAERDASRRAKVEQTQPHARALRQLMRYLRGDRHPLGGGENPFTGDAAP
jgi:F-type H+-transporting ATPase subunit epsilon